MPWFNDLLDPQLVGPSAGAILSGMELKPFDYDGKLYEIESLAVPCVPNFEQIAYNIACSRVESIELLDDQIAREPHALDDIIDVLRQVWNARGAADAAAVNLLDEAPRDMTTAAIRELDR